MSCRRARRELLWLVRFGDFDAGSEPHLEHLAGCRACRDEVGLDRALVRQLRTVLATRVTDASPSPSAWEGVLARMRRPEPRPSGLRAWSERLLGGLRAGTAMAGASLALVLALNLEVVPIGPAATPPPEPSRVSGPTLQALAAGDIPPFIDVAPPAAATFTEPQGTEEGAPLVVVAPDSLEPLFPGWTNSTSTSDQAPAQPSGPSGPGGNGEPSEAPDDEWRILVRLLPTDAATMAEPANESMASGGGRPEPVPDPPFQGPS